MRIYRASNRLPHLQCSGEKPKSQSSSCAKPLSFPENKPHYFDWSITAEAVTASHKRTQITSSYQMPLELGCSKRTGNSWYEVLHKRMSVVWRKKKCLNCGTAATNYTSKAIKAQREKHLWDIGYVWCGSDTIITLDVYIISVHSSAIFLGTPVELRIDPNI